MGTQQMCGLREELQLLKEWNNSERELLRSDIKQWKDSQKSEIKEFKELCRSEIKKIDGLTIYGESQNKAGIISFTLDNVHPHDIGTIIDSRGVAVRAGHHCAQPLMDRFEITATARTSFGMYNNKADVDVLVAALDYAKEIFS